MSELIDREATVKQICKMGKMLGNYHDRDVTIAIALFVQDDKSAFPTVERPRGECKTCKHYAPYREQFSYRHRGDGYCKRAVTTSEGEAYMNCHDEWYCANYEKEGDPE